MPADTRRSTRHAFMELGGEDVTSRRCDNCGTEMKHLSDLPGHLGAAPIRIYGCDRCNRVVSESR
jgi:transposase